MANEKTVKLEPSTKASGNLKKLAERARRMNDRFVAEGRRFSDSTEIVRADRDSR